MKRLVSIMVLVLFSALNVSAQETMSGFDPLERNLLFVEGSASLVVAVDGFRIGLEFETEKSTFEEASREADRITSRIEKQMKAAGLEGMEIIKGWNLVKQAKISFTSSERKITNKVVIDVRQFPKGKLQETIARVIDIGLATDRSVVLENISVYVTRDREQAKREEVAQAALAQLEANARRSAAVLGQTGVVPKRVYVTSSPAVQMPAAERFYSFDKIPSSAISINKGFKVNAEISDHVTLDATVSGVYEIQPPKEE